MPHTCEISPQRVLVLGATGTIGRATVAALRTRGHGVVTVGRRAAALQGAEARVADVTSPAALLRDGIRGERFDAVVSCLASRSGVPAEAWAIDHGANMALLAAAREAGVGRFVLLSAICVQRPRLAFQHAKLAFEAELRASPLTWSIVRPTAYFKSLSGQIARVEAGKPFLVFGDGRLTACKPISDGDLGAFIAACVDTPARENRVLPIGGPGPAITPLDQAAALGRLLGREVPIRRVPPGLLRVIAGGLALAGRVAPRLAAKAELARIGHYYATESMLLLDPETGQYDADATPETGHETLFDHYADVLAGRAQVERGAHAVF